MGPITLKNVRASSDITVNLRLKDGGMYIAWTSLADIKAYIFSDVQRAIAGRCDVSIDGDDSTLLICNYSANKPQYLGVNSIVIRANYDGRIKTYDRRAFNIVKRTSAVSGDVVLDDPVVDLELEVADVSSSLLDMAIALAFKAVEEWDQVTVTERGPEGKSAYRVAVDNGFVGTEEEWLDSLVGPEGPRGRQGVQGETGPAGVSSAEVVIDESTGEPHAEISVINGLLRLVLSGIKGEQGIQGPQGIQGIQGPQGIQGETGPKGEDGDAGEPGEPGPQGERGPAGVTSAVVSVSNTTGTPSATATVNNGVLAIAISGIKGEQGVQGIQGPQGVQGEQGPQGSTGPAGPQGIQGNTGSSVEYPYELVNNRTTNDATKGLSSAEGYRIGEDIDRLGRDKVDRAPGKNLYDSRLVTTGMLNATGTIDGGNAFRVSAYIKVSPSTDYCLHTDTGAALDNRVYTCFYDSDYVFISSIKANVKTFTTPANTAFLRFGTAGSVADRVQLELGTVETGYVPYDEMYGYTGELKESVAKKVDKNPINLYDKDNVTEDVIINDGTIRSSENYYLSDYMPVESGKNYYVSARGGAPASNGINVRHAFFDDGKKMMTPLVSSTTQLLTAPTGAHFLRVSIDVNAEDVMVTQGTERLEYYQGYSPIAGYDPVLRDGQVAIRHLDATLQEKIQGKSSFNRMHGSETLQAGAALGLQTCHVQKNTLLVARITGTIETVAAGYGVTDNRYARGWVEVTQTTLTFWRHYTSDQKLGEYTHGLTLTNDTTIEIDFIRNGGEETCTVRIHDGLGNIFEQVLPSAIGQGKPFVKNSNSSGAIDADLSFYPRDLVGRIWVFGDSYISMRDASRWPYYLAIKDMDKWLVNGFPGQGSTSAMEDLEALLALKSIPSYIVWTLGMNDNGDSQSEGEYVINPGTKAVIDSLVELCADNGIEPVIATVPTTPYHQNTGKNNYIKSLGCRVIDFSDAVGADSSGNWKTGLLYSDNVHPTQAGAKVLASRAILDFPELSIILQ